MSPVKIIEPERFGDSRGWFTETYSEQRFAAHGITTRFVQDNHSFSVPRFTLRGLHFQSPPHGQDKLIRCVRGRIFDVSVDIRGGSPTYGHWVSAELSAANGHQMYIPVGFAHAFLTLEADCEVVYKVSDTYAPACEGGIRWDSVSIDWPIPLGKAPLLSAKDTDLPALADLKTPFSYDGRPLVPVT
jgi:dTDP-4-dehydrorhamnose 3,5-epimerase